jgi:hypothetical protein
MAQANPQLASMQQLMQDTLNREYAMYLTPFGSELGEQPANLQDRIIAAANDVPKVITMMQVNPMSQIIFIHHPTWYVPSLLGTQP